MPTVFVTGASRGLGLEFCRQYAAAGWQVLGGCRDPRGAEALKKAGVAVYKLNVDSDASVTDLARALEGQAIDVLILNAGVGTRERDRLGILDYGLWRDVLNTNLLGAMRVAEALLSHLGRGSLRKIVGITSGLGSHARLQREGGGNRGAYYIYRTSKAALNMAMQGLAVDLAPRGFVCVALHPGWVRTDMGGPSAPLDVTQSVAGMRKTIDRLNAKDNGRFLGHDGAEMAW